LSNLSPKKAVFRAPAKLNLGLEIVGRRPNGFHELQSLFWPIDLCDDLEMTQAEEIEVQADWAPDAARKEPLPQNESNLVYRALEKLGVTYSVKVQKRIPMGAGLGGGSSDAGSVLGQFGFTDDKAASELGADVPFFLSPVPTWVEGIGERRQKLTLIQDLCFLLVIPPKPLGTPEVFKTYRASGVPFSARRKLPVLPKYLQTAKNDLTPSAITLYPLVGEILEQLAGTGPLFSSMTGSGSTCFAIYASKEDREKSAKVLQPFLRKTYCTSLFARSF